VSLVRLVPLLLAFVVYTVSVRRVAKFPNPEAPGVPGSGRNWVLGAVAYIACWTIWIFGVFLGYELMYSFYRRWRFRESYTIRHPNEG
jgi:hypothetical protein